MYDPAGLQKIWKIIEMEFRNVNENAHLYASYINDAYYYIDVTPEELADIMFYKNDSKPNTIMFIHTLCRLYLK